MMLNCSECTTANQATTCTGATPVCNNNACSGCKKSNGDPGDGSAQENCPRPTDKCQNDGTCTPGNIRNKRRKRQLLVTKLSLFQPLSFFSLSKRKVSIIIPVK